MNYENTGTIIRRLRLEAGLTQSELASRLFISDKTVSKWERGLGLPDVALLSKLSTVLNVNIEEMLQGELNANDTVGGNMKKTKYFVCPVCNNLILATGDAAIYCCGRKLEPCVMQKADDATKLNIENIEDDYYITSGHPMTKENYIAFVALSTGDRLELVRLYPEWDLQARLTRRHGLLLYYSTSKGLIYQNI
ncbi:MAG: helix-turn-helix domain-containing protein [Clostridiales bacterium]|nr:helix-turn-helix domain-containing protein [Clostridiales bacterium]